MYRDSYNIIKQVKSDSKFKNLSFYTLTISLALTPLDKLQKAPQQFPCMVIMANRGIWFGAIFPYMVNGGK